MFQVGACAWQRKAHVQSYSQGLPVASKGKRVNNNLSCRVPSMLSSMVGDQGLTESLAVTSRTVTQPGAKSPESRGRPYARTYARAARTRQPTTSRLCPRQRRMCLTITDECGTFLPNGLQLQCDPARSKKSRTTRTTLCTHMCMCSLHGTAKYFSTLFRTAQDVLTITDESGTFLPNSLQLMTYQPKNSYGQKPASCSCCVFAGGGDEVGGRARELGVGSGVE